MKKTLKTTQKLESNVAILVRKYDLPDYLISTICNRIKEVVSNSGKLYTIDIHSLEYTAYISVYCYGMHISYILYGGYDPRAEYSIGNGWTRE